MGRNRKLNVVTAELMMFTMEAERWELNVNELKNSVKVWKATGEQGMPSDLVAYFPDVSAVYFSDDVELVKADE